MQYSSRDPGSIGIVSLCTLPRCRMLVQALFCVAITPERKFFMTNYTGEQKRNIMQMPAAVLLSAILADSGSAVVGMREFMAGEKFISEAGTMFAGNSLIQDMIKNMQ